MSFDSLSYLLFLPAVFLLHRVCPPKRRWALLLAASYYFYMSWNPALIFLIVGTTLVSYGAGLLIGRSESPRFRKGILVTALVLCLGVLVFFRIRDKRKGR